MWNWIKKLFNPEEVFIEECESWNPDFHFYERVPKYTKAGKAGKTIYCPKCGAPQRVMNFSWLSMMCMSCNHRAEKNSWFMAKK